MTRLLVTAAVLAALALALLFALADADAQATFFAGTSASLFVIIVVVILLTSAVTALFIRGFTRFGDRLTARKLHRFLGWKLLRSQRHAQTRGSALRDSLHRLRSRSWRATAGLGALAAALLAIALWLNGPAAFNAIAEPVSPTFASALQVACLAIGALFLVAVLIRVAAPARADEPPPPTFRKRSAVTLPTFISIVGVAIGVWALIVVLGVMNGLQSDLREKILRTNAHLVIEPDEPGDVIRDGIALEDAIRALPGVVEAHAFVHDELMIGSPSGHTVITLKGMTAEAMATSDQLRGRIVAGGPEWITRPEALVPDRYRHPMGGLPSPGDDLDGDADGGAFPSQPLGALPHRAEVMPGILVGVELARNLGVRVGDEVHLICSECGVSPAGLTARQRSFRIAGTFKTGMYQYDQRLAYVALDEAQRYLNYARHANRLEARLARSEDAPAVKDAVIATLAAEPSFSGLVASDWQERDRTLYAALGLERLVMFIILAFIILVASFLIVSSLAMLVVEKLKEIAVLKALGATDRSVVRAFLVIGTFIGVFGALAGIPLGLGTAAAIIAQGVTLPREFYIDELPVRLDVVEVVIVGVAAVTICLLATLYPAYQASKLRPADGLRHG